MAILPSQKIHDRQQVFGSDRFQWHDRLRRGDDRQAIAGVAGDRAQQFFVEPAAGFDQVSDAAARLNAEVIRHTAELQVEIDDCCAPPRRVVLCEVRSEMRRNRRRAAPTDGASDCDYRRQRGIRSRVIRAPRQRIERRLQELIGIER